MIIRNYNNDDESFVIELAPRFSDLRFMNYRNSEDMTRAQKLMAIEAVKNNSSNIFIAEDDGCRLGYLEVKDRVDYFSGKKQGYLAAIAVTEEAEGTGVGKLLLEKAESWAKQKGYSELVLQVFNSNNKAIKLYNNEGYQSEITVMVKEL